MIRIAIATGAALALAGCGPLPGGEDNETVTEDAGDVVTEEAVREPMTPTDPDIASRLFNGGEPLRLDLQQQHANGTVVRLTSIQARSTETIVTAELVNGGQNDAYFNRFDNWTYLQSMDGQEYFISPPPTNEDLNIASGQRMQAELVFMGRIPTDEPILVMFNKGETGSSRVDSSPGFRFEIPVPGQARSGGGSTMQTAPADAEVQ